MGKIALVFILVMASATFYLTSTSFQASNTSTQQRTWVDEHGKLHVLGIVLGESTVRDAELALRSRTDAAIFMYPLDSKELSKQPSQDKMFKLVLEAYFPSIADHSKVMMKLDIDDAQMEAMRLRSTSPRIYPNGVARMNLSNEDILTVRTLKIRELTLMPSTQLTADILESQFGKTDLVKHIDSNISTYNYPTLGLIATIDNNGKDKLVFRNAKPKYPRLKEQKKGRP